MNINDKYYFRRPIGGTTCGDTHLEQLHKWSIHTDTSDHTGELLLKNIYDSFVESKRI